jgi:hypothetical protein
MEPTADTVKNASWAHLVDILLIEQIWSREHFKLLHSECPTSAQETGDVLLSLTEGVRQTASVWGDNKHHSGI